MYHCEATPTHPTTTTTTTPLEMLNEPMAQQVTLLHRLEGTKARAINKIIWYASAFGHM